MAQVSVAPGLGASVGALSILGLVFECIGFGCGWQSWQRIVSANAVADPVGWPIRMKRGGLLIAHLLDQVLVLAHIVIALAVDEALLLGLVVLGVWPVDVEARGLYGAKADLRVILSALVLEWRDVAGRPINILLVLDVYMGQVSIQLVLLMEQEAWTGAELVHARVDVVRVASENAGGSTRTAIGNSVLAGGTIRLDTR